jgi:hypothetical protein
MRTLYSAVLLTLSLTTPALSAFAADRPAAPEQNDIRSKFYDMGEQVIDGEIKRPQAVWLEGHRRADFGRLLSLKKSFLSRITDSGADRVFK